MEPTTITTSATTPGIGGFGGLPDERAEWAEDAQRAYRSVLRQLDTWCRERNLPRHSNGWMAEEAIRRAW